MGQANTLDKANRTSEDQPTFEKDKPSSAIRKERAERLKYLRELTRLSRQEFAKHYKLPYGSLQNWEDPKYGGLTKTGAPRVISALKEEGIFVNSDWLLYAKGPAPYVSALVLLKRMQIKRSNEQQSMASAPISETAIIGEELGLFKHHYQDILEATVQDDAMSPAFEKGDQVAGKKYASQKIKNLVGQVCIVMTENKQVLVRKLAASTQPNRYNLLCINPSAKAMTIENANVLSASPVLWMRRPLNPKDA